MATKKAAPPTAREDLAWLFGACESEMGIRSTFHTFILASKAGASRPRTDDSGQLVNAAQEELHDEDSMIDALDRRRAASRLGAAARNRRIMAAYARLPPGQQRVLEAAYEPRQYEPRTRAVFGEIAGVAALTETARRLSCWSRQWLERALGRGDARAARIRAEAVALFNEALEAFERARSAA